MYYLYFLINSFIDDSFYVFILDLPYYGFFGVSPSLWNNTIGKNIFINGIFYLIITFIINLGLLLLGRLIYKKLNLKRKNYGNIYFLAFVLRLFPVISIFASILLGMNDEKLSKVIKIFSIGFILYTIVGFILYKYFDLSWLHLFYSGD